MKRKVVPSGDGSQHEQRKVKPPAVEIFQALFQARNRKAASLDVTATPIARGHGEEAKENAPSGDAIVRLNVGGQVMMTYRSTLASAPAGSLLARMFGGEDGAGENGAWRPPRLADGSYFFDNNPEHFAIVLGVLRHGPCLLEDLSAHTRHGVHVLADYLGLVDIAEQCAPCGSTPVYNVAGGAHVPMADRRVIAVMGQGHMWRNGFEMGELGTCPRLVVCRTWHLAWIRDLVADMCHVPSEHAVVYACALRKNRTIRVDGLITPESSAPVFSICGRNFKHADAVVVVLDHALPVCLLSPADGGKTPVWLSPARFSPIPTPFARLASQLTCALWDTRRTMAICPRPRIPNVRSCLFGATIIPPMPYPRVRRSSWTRAAP